MRASDFVLDALKDLIAAEKTCPGVPVWTAHPNKAEHVYCTTSLWVGEALRFGLRLDVHGPKLVRPDRPFFGLTAMVYANAGTERLHIARLEFDPANALQTHRNPRNFVGAPTVVSGPHFHPFAENLSFGKDALTPDHDLPIAFPFEGAFATFHDVQEALRTHLGIPGLWLEEPPCSTTIV